jgi:regulator of replication initiation timing
LLARQKQRFERWSERRERELEERAKRLVAQQQELDAHTTQVARSNDAWQLERLELQRRIRHLEGAGKAESGKRKTEESGRGLYV